MIKQIVKLTTLSALASSFVLGATPNIGDIEKQIKTPDIKKEQPSIPQIKPSEYKTPMVDSGKAILVKDFKITGNAHIPSSELEAFFAESKNKELTFKQLQDIASAITQYYREKGYFVARAYIPEQNITATDGVLEIAIVEGNYGEFRLKNGSLVKDSIVQGMFDDVKDENIISTYTLERAMLIINDTPGAVVTGADVMPGKEVGTSDFAITTSPSKAYDGYVFVDNTGSRYTGKNRLMAGVNINSLTGIGDKLSLFGLISNGSDLKNGRVAYSAPLMPNGLRGELSYAQTNYTLGEEYANLDAVGSSKTIEAKLSYPVLRTRAENLYVNFSLLSKNLKDEIRSTDNVTQKDTKSLRVGMDYDKSYLAYGLNSNSKVSLNYTYGKLSFDDSAKELADANGADTHGNYSKINLDLAHNIALDSKFSLESSLKMQYALAHKNLDGSEDFSIGGSSGVKVYPDAELSAENGYLFSTELKYRLPEWDALSSSAGVFYDRGRAFMANNTTGFDAKSLQDIGVGYYASYKNFFGQIQVAWTLNSEAVSSEPSANSRILFQGGMSF